MNFAARLLIVIQSSADRVGWAINKLTVGRLREPRRLRWDKRLLDKDRATVAKLNASLARLSKLRAIEINRSGPLQRSKIAWKLVTYQHALLHRIVALMDGAAVAWNTRCTLSAILSARALMETIAVMAEFEAQVNKGLADEDLGHLDRLVQNGIFATRDEEMLKDHPEIKSVNALTYIDKFDRRVPGFKGLYAILSERCHPNSLGHNFLFSKLDRTSATVTYGSEREHERNGQMIFAGLVMLPLTESVISRLDELILKVSDLQHRLAPVIEHP